MAISRRRDIILYIRNLLRQEVRGYFDGAILEETEEAQIMAENDDALANEDIVTRYDYKRSVFKNVFNGLKFLDQINDFPSIYIQAGQEVYNYDSKTATIGVLELMIRVYAYEENGIHALEDIVDDVVHVLERINFSQDHRIINCRVISVDTDNGLLDPYGLGEVSVEVTYDVED